MTDFVNAVSSVGFPIACCIFLLWQNAKQDEQRQRELSAMRKVMGEMQKTLDKTQTALVKVQEAQTENTRVLQSLVSMLMKGEKVHVQTENDKT